MLILSGVMNNGVANATLSSSTTSSSTVKQEGEWNQLPSQKIKRKSEKKNMLQHGGRAFPTTRSEEGKSLPTTSK